MSGIADWLEQQGLGAFADVLVREQVDFEVLPELSEADLKELGLPLGPRKKLLKAIRELRASVPPCDEPASTPPTPRAPTAVAGEAERRQLTVLFCDLVGSTALSANLDPEDTRKVVLRYQDLCAGVIARFEGFLARFMGDGVLAYFAYPKAHEDEAERAVRAGLALVGAVSELKAPSGEALAARVGIATGVVVVGDLVGDGPAQEQAVVGDAPNLAARLQGIAAPGQVVIGDTTRQLVSAGFVLEDLGERELKGIDGPVHLTTVVGERHIESRFEARSDAQHPMVGRDQELALLMERWSLAKSGEGQGVLLVGEAGIGKSRIGRALLDAVAEKPHARLQYQCSPYYRDSMLWPVIQQLGHGALI